VVTKFLKIFIEKAKKFTSNYSVKEISVTIKNYFKEKIPNFTYNQEHLLEL